MTDTNSFSQAQQEHPPSCESIDASVQSYPLTDVAGSLSEPGQFLEIAIECSRSLSDYHSRHLVYQHINPQNLLWDDQRRRIILKERFSISYSADQEGEAYPVSLSENDLAYMSPEQTRRMNRRLDYRTDLYSLGVSLYELLAGKKPFMASDVLGWFHQHIAHSPPPLSVVVPGMPGMLSDIVMKLLEKNPENRYQTAQGLKLDLERCLQMWMEGKEIETFVPGEFDISERLLIPQKLYGRRMEKKTMMNAFQRICDGRCGLMLVNGYAGIGKTSLVHEICQEVVKRSAFYTEGKFDQLRRNIPYSALIMAFRGLVRQLLMGDRWALDRWKSALMNVLGANGQIIIDAIPELELIIGKQPAIAALNPDETRNRFNLVFQNFVKVFATAEHPLVVFIDDFQFADFDSFKLLETLLTDIRNEYLLFVAAFRDYETEGEHPIQLSLEAIRDAGVEITEMHLRTLHAESINRMLADALHLPSAQTDRLAALITEKTMGNPFFVNQLIRKIHEDGLLYFNPPKGRWEWDLEGIRAQSMSDNVIDLLAVKIGKLSPATRHLITLAACIGIRFDLDILNALSGYSQEETRNSLGEMIREGLVAPDQGSDILETLEGFEREDFFQFQHDRIQEAAYSILDHGASSHIHLKIGRLLLVDKAEEMRPEEIFTVVDHMNRAVELIVSNDERILLARRNLAAGQKAKESTAYSQSVNYFRCGISALPGDSWDSYHELAYVLHRELSESEYLVGHHETAQELFELVLGNCHNRIEKAEMYNIIITLYGVQGRFVENNREGMKALELFGYSFPELDDQTAIGAAIAAEIEAYRHTLGGREIRELLAIPVMASPERDVCARIIRNMFTPAFISNPALLTLLCLKSINDSIEYGIQPDQDYVFAAAALVLGTYRGDYETGYEYGQMAFKLNEQNRMIVTRAVIFHTVGMMVHHWRRPFNESLEYLREAFRSGQESGDYVYATNAAIGYARMLLSYGHHKLQYVLEETDRTIFFMQRIRNSLSVERQELIRHVIFNLMGKTDDATSFSGDGFDESMHLQSLKDHNHGTGIGGYYLYKTMSSCLYGRYLSAREFSLAGEAYLPFLRSFPLEADYCFFQSLAMVACAREEANQFGQQDQEKIAGNIKKLRIWSENCTENYYGKYALIMAENAALNRQSIEAEEWFERSISSSRENGRLMDRALASERAAIFYERRGLQGIATFYLGEACRAYADWGAEALASRLEQSRPGIAGEDQVESGGTGASLVNIDAFSVVKASQAISGEIEITRLLEALMGTVLENAGAQKAVLILTTGDEMQARAEAVLENEKFEIHHMDDCQSRLLFPQSLANLVHRTGEAVILEDATEHSMFFSDPYFINFHPVSILCLPVIRQANMVGILYLENNLIKGAFTVERIAVLELLVSQAAISLENALLYEQHVIMEEELKVLNRRLVDIIEFLPDATFVVDIEGRVIAWNRAMEKLSLTSSSYMLGKGHYEYSVPIYGNRRPVLLDLIVKPDEKVEQQYKYIRREGDYIYGEVCLADSTHLEAAAAVLRDAEGKIAGAIETLRNVSEARRAEAERDRLRYLLANIIDSMPSILVGIDRNRQVTQWNTEAARVTGVSGEEAIGKPIDEVFGMFEAQMESLGRALAEQRFQREELVSFDSEGGKHYAEVMIYPLIADQVEGAVIRIDDVTDKVRLQEMIIQTEKMMTVGGLAAGMAHELNNPLSGILQSIQNIENRFSPELKKNIETAEECGTSMEAIQAYIIRRNISEFLKGIRTSGARAARIISNMLQFSRRSEAGKTLVQLSALLDRTLELAANDYDLARGFDFRHIEIIKKYADDLGDVYCSPTEIEQVVLNLLKNSAHAMTEPQQPQRKPRIVIKAYQEDDMAVIEVEDNGPGMSEEIKKKVFEPFFTTKSPGQGTGLGLSVSYFIVANNHDGQMSVESTPGDGTTVIIRLPIMQKTEK